MIAGCAHGTASSESIRFCPSWSTSWLIPFAVNAVLSCKVPARFTGLAVVMIRAGRSHGVEDHGYYTLSVLFKLKLEQMPCLSVGVLPPRGLSESRKFTKISCKPGHGLSRKKKHAAELPVSQGTERMRLVLSSSWAFWYRWFSLCKKTSTPQTCPTHYVYNSTRVRSFYGE